jgi:hypothetical protein
MKQIAVLAVAAFVLLALRFVLRRWGVDAGNEKKR